MVAKRKVYKDCSFLFAFRADGSILFCIFGMKTLKKNNKSI
jgi:hypothetical protein